MNGIYILLGTTFSGYYLGITYKINEFYEDTKGAYQRYRNLDLSIFKDKELVLILEKNIVNIKFISEFFEGLVWEIAKSRDALLHNILSGIFALVSKKNIKPNLTDLYPQRGGCCLSDLEVTKEAIVSYEQTMNFLFSQLTDIRIYHLIDAIADDSHKYSVGKTKNGDWIIVRIKWSCLE